MRVTIATLAFISGLLGGFASAEEKPVGDDGAALIDAPEIDLPIRENKGFYARLDAGYNAFMDAGSPTYRSYNSGTYTTDRFNEARFDANFSIGAGIGYQFNDTFRADVTADYFRTKFNAKGYAASSCATSSTGTATCTFDNQRMNAVTGLVNGYADLGTYLGVTPYVGAGAGIARVNWGNSGDSHGCNGGTCADADYSGSAGQGAASWRFAYAAMAGFSYDISDRLKLDIGYRYQRVAKGRMLDFSGFDAAQGASGARAKDRGLSRHEIRMGLRLMSW